MYGMPPATVAVSIITIEQLNDESKDEWNKKRCKVCVCRSFSLTYLTNFATNSFNIDRRPSPSLSLSLFTILFVSVSCC